MVAALLGASPDDVPLVAEASRGPAEFLAQVPQVPAADVPQLDPLEVIPDALVRVQLRRVAGQLLQADALGPAPGQEVLDRLPAMDRRAVPDHQQLAGDVAEQVPEEADDVRALGGPLPDHHQQPPFGRDAAADRQVVAAQPQAQDRRLPARGVRADEPRQQVEAGFVYPDDGPAFLVSPFLSAGQRSACQAAIAASSRWLARRIGFWAVQPAARRSLPT
jgi:hypothetical protein